MPNRETIPKVSDVREDITQDVNPSDPAIPLDDVPEYIPGRRVHRATPWRWSLHGIKRNGVVIRLETFKVGGRRYTTPSDIAKFLAMCNDESVPTATAPALSSRAEVAGRLLDARGVR